MAAMLLSGMSNPLLACIPGRVVRGLAAGFKANRSMASRKLIVIRFHLWCLVGNLLLILEVGRLL